MRSSTTKGGVSERARNVKAARHHFDVSGRLVLVALAFTPQDHFARDLDDVLGAGFSGGVHGGPGAPRAVEDHLHDAAAVPDRQEDQLSEIAPPTDPSADPHAAPRVGGTQLPGRLAFLAQSFLRSASFN